MPLTPDTELQYGRYRIERELYRDAASITYVAQNSLMKVAIREYCGGIRKEAERFYDAGRAMAGISHPNVALVTDVFEENDTCYIVMDYAEGESLDAMMPVCEADAQQIVADIQDALRFLSDYDVHGFNLSPNRIIKRLSDDRYILTDYGISFGSDSNATDIAGQCANLYSVLTGKKMPEPDPEPVYETPEPSVVYQTPEPEVVYETPEPSFVYEKPEPELVYEKPEPEKIIAPPPPPPPPPQQRPKPAQGNNGTQTTPPPAPDNKKKTGCGCLLILAIFIGIAYFSGSDDDKQPPTTYEEDEPIDIDEVYFDNLEFVEGGTFTMGPCNNAEEQKDFSPAHKVTVKSFYISSTEVTYEQWIAVMGNLPEGADDSKSYDYPVNYVTYADVMEFIRRLNEMAKYEYRLPTEAEWEFAARGGNNSHDYIYSGGNDINRVAWYRINTASFILPVGYHKEPNELGLYDMSGNLYEYVSDNYGPYPIYDQFDPRGAEEGMHIIRGGSFLSDDYECNVRYRKKISGDKPREYIGFRLAISTTEATEDYEIYEEEAIEEEAFEEAYEEPEW